MSISATEISELIKKKIQDFDLDTDARTEGTVVSLSDGIARIHGLSDAHAGGDDRVPRQHLRSCSQP